MDIVVDTSVLLAVMLDEPTKPSLVAATRGADLYAPSSVSWEVGNALSAMFKRRRLTLQQALDALKAYDRIPIRFVEVELTQAVNLSERLDIYANDAYVIACAINQRSPLISLDRGLIQAARKAGVSLIEVA